MPNILLIDDNQAYCEQIKKSLNLREIDITYETDPQRGLEKVVQQTWDAVLLDMVLNDELDGLDILKKIKQHKPELPVIMISGSSTMYSAIESLKQGAFDYLEKPIDLDRLVISLKHAVSFKQLSFLIQNLQEEFESNVTTVGLGEPLHQALEHFTNTPEALERLLIIGEPGTGKELLAKLLHYKSARRFGPFLTFRCDLEGERCLPILFGENRNCADPVKTGGLIEQANGGTIFFREISYLPIEGQKCLLQFLHQQFFMPAQRSEQTRLDIRIIVSSSTDLKQAIEKGTFLSELYEIISSFIITIPPLRERLHDIPPMVDHFLTTEAERLNMKKPQVNAEALHFLQTQSWKNNIAELKRVVELMALLSRSETIDLETAKTALEINELLHGSRKNLPLSAVRRSLKEILQKANHG